MKEKSYAKLNIALNVTNKSQTLKRNSPHFNKNSKTITPKN